MADTVAVVVQPGSGDVLQFLKAGIMEIPDVLVVTKADLGEVALRARRDLHAALRSLGDRDTEVVARLLDGAGDRASTSWSAALDAHRDAPRPAARGAWRRGARARWPTSPPSTASAACARSAAAAPRERALADADPGADVPALVAALEGQAAGA